MNYRSLKTLFTLRERNRGSDHISFTELGSLGITREEFKRLAAEHCMLVQESTSGFLYRYDHPPLLAPVQSVRVGHKYLVGHEGRWYLATPTKLDLETLRPRWRLLSGESAPELDSANLRVYVFQED